MAIKIKLLCLLLVTYLLGLATPSMAGEPVLTLSDEGQTSLSIVASPDSLTAANSLASYLSKITDASFKVRIGQALPDSNAIIVGSFPSLTEAINLPGDSFIVQIDPHTKRIYLYGTTPRATASAVFAFLQNQLGCRWWSFNEEDVPHQTTIQLAAFKQIHKAIFLQTDLRNQEAYSDHNGFNDKLQSISTLEHTTSHSMYNQVEAYGKTHPEIYPYSKKTGKRSKNKIHLCYTAPGLAEAIAASLEKEIKARHGDVANTIYMSDMGDAYGGICECDVCTAVYQEEAWTKPDGTVQRAPSATLLRLINHVAEILEAKHPGIRIITQAYMTLEGPPGKTVPRHNVYIRVPHLRHCIIHGIDQCQKNKRYYDDLKRWCELAPGRVFAWDYTVNFKENFLFPLPNIHSIARNIKVYAKLGVIGMTLQGNYASTGGDLVVLKNYVWSRLMQNPDLDVDQLITEFCNGYYGPASQTVQDYVNALENSVSSNIKVHVDEFATLPQMRAAFLSSELRQTLAKSVEQARQLTQGHAPFDRRVEELAVSLEAVNLWGTLPLVEGPKGLYRETNTGPVYTYDRAVSMIEHSRQASFREWAAFRSYQQPFLTLHGGPLAELKSASVQVKVAPALGMRIWQVLFQGQPLLWVPHDAQQEGFPLIGGAYEEMTPHLVYGTLAKPTNLPNTINLSAIHESRSSIKAYSSKQVSLDDHGIIHIELATKSANVRSGWKSAGGDAVVEYSFDPKGSVPRVEVRDATGTWKPITLTKPAPVATTRKKSKKKKANLTSQIELQGPILAMRVALPGRHCSVEDRLAGENASFLQGKITIDWTLGRLTTSLDCPHRSINEKTLTTWLQRELQITPLP